MKNCTNCGAPIRDKEEYCPFCNAVCGKKTGEGNAEPEVKAQQYPMRWYKFQLVMLIIGAVCGILAGISIIAGEKVLTTRGLEDAGAYYGMYPGLKNCCRFSAVTSIAMSVFAFIVWKRLKEYRANGPISFKVLYVLGIILSIINLSWTSTAMNTNLFSARNCCAIIGCAVILIINSTYYAKRMELFVN